MPSTTFPRLLTLVLLLSVLVPGIQAQAPPPGQADYYRIVTLPIPDDVVLEVGGLTVLPDGRPAAATRRGEVWLVDGAYTDPPRPTFTRFAQGLHEPLGLLAHGGALYTSQRGELTRLHDRDGDGRADRYETVYRWPLSGNYHEYSYGPELLPNGNLFVTLNLAWVGRGASPVPWRGWALEITPDGTMTPIATGMRSPAGFGLDAAGAMFYAENQGDWVGSGRMTHIEPGDFVGHPDGLRWTDEPGSPLALRIDDVPDTGEPMHVIAESVAELKPPAVWFPHTLMGISTSDILLDDTDGAFGPFTEQLFVGDQGHSKVMRVFLEEVNGVYQGACFPFLEGFASGVLRLAWGQDQSLFVGMTSRGWAATGPEPYALQRVVWTGRTPFEIQEIHARPDGFELHFTQPVDRAAARALTSYEITSFTYQYHHRYGSPVVDRAGVPVQRVVVAADGRSARLVVDGLRKGYIHEIKAPGVRNRSGEALRHSVAYYTLNEIPDGPALAATAPPARPAATAPAAQPVQQFKHQTEMPADWADGPDVTIAIATEPGLRFDQTAFSVPAGARVRLVFTNDDDMLHNLVITHPGRVDAVANAALSLGLDGPDLGYVPRSDDVLFHTGLLQPETAESIYFTAPEAPDAYPYVCTFPGHAYTMRGVMTVTPAAGTSSER